MRMHTPAKDWTCKMITTLPPESNAPWDDAQDADLRRMASEGLSRAEIASAMGRSLMGIRGRCQKLGVRFPRDTYGGLRYHSELQHHEQRAQIEARDRRMVRALAVAIANGDHL